MRHQRQLKSLVFIFLSLLAISFSSCQKNESNTTVKYNTEIKSLITNYCTTCHNSFSPSANLDLTSYENVKQAAKTGNLLNRINDAQNPMPPSGLLSKDKIEKIKNWAKNGYQK